MLRELRLPDLGEGVTEGEVVTWLVAAGDTVAEDTPLLEVMTDKASVEIPSPFTGVVARLHVEAGTTVPVGTVLVTVEDGATDPAGVSASTNGHRAAAGPHAPPSRAPALPSTRRLARRLGVDLADVVPTGPRGRIRDTDVQGAAAARAQPPAPAPARPQVATPAPAPATQVATPAPAAATPLPRSSAVAAARGGAHRIALGGVRRRIADHLTVAARIPTVTFVEEAEFDRLDALRRRIETRDLTRISYLPFLILAVCSALRRMPLLNSSLDEAAGEIVIHGDVNIGIATDTADGLMVPVIRHADRMSIHELHAALSGLAASARERRLRPEQLAGSTFTVSSPGRWGGLMATPILNAPETALLALHRAAPRPVVRDGEVVVRTVGNLSLTFDHRVIDGITAARFTQMVIDGIEEPALLAIGVPAGDA